MRNTMHEEDKLEPVINEPDLMRIESRTVRHSEFCPRSKKSQTHTERESGSLEEMLDLPNNEQREEPDPGAVRLNLQPTQEPREGSESEDEKSSNESGGAVEDERGGGVSEEEKAGAEVEESVLQKRGAARDDMSLNVDEFEGPDPSQPRERGKSITDAYATNDINEIIEKEKSRSGSFIGISPRVTRRRRSEPANFLFKELSRHQEERIRKESPYGSLQSWRLLRIIVKSNDDLRQEQFAMQLISQIHQIFKLKKLPLWLKVYEILATGPSCGLIEGIPDSMSIDGIKKKLPTGLTTLLDYFRYNYGAETGRCKSQCVVTFECRLQAGARGFLLVASGLLACVLPAADQGQAQREHHDRRGGAHHAHRLRVPAVQCARQGAALRESAFQADEGLRGRVGRHELEGLPALPRPDGGGLRCAAGARGADHHSR